MKPLPDYHSLGWIVFQFTLITLALFRAVRFVTTDTFPPMAAIREWIEGKLKGHWDDLITCNWCVSVYAVAIFYGLGAQFLNIPLPVLQAAATSGIIGFLGNYDD